MDSGGITTKNNTKNLFTNVINRQVERAISQTKITKTILATIQYCIDKSNGQYKIKYQNSYLTAYADGSNDYTYSTGASVFVLVPDGDFKNRLLILGSASSNNNDKVYLTNLTDDQKYKAIGSNLLEVASEHPQTSLNLSSYLCGEEPEEEYIKYYYYYQEPSEEIEPITNYFRLNDTVLDNIKRKKTFRLGVRFQTQFKDSRKSNGDYGIRVVIAYQAEDGGVEYRTYELNTFSMSGTPFDFTLPVPQYMVWELTEPERILYIKSIAGFTRLFPESQEDPFDDILVSNISINAVEKLYDTRDDAYRVQIDSPNDNFLFSQKELNQTVGLVARFFAQTIEVTGKGTENLEYYWGKQDSQVDKASNPRYCSELGVGWYCLNNCSVKKTNSSAQSIKQDATKTYTPQDSLTQYKRSDLTYYTNSSSINLPITLCRGKETVIKCVVKYGDTYYSSLETIVYNETGYYVLLGEINNKTVTHNGSGFFTLGAGVFFDNKSQTDAPDNSMVLDPRITYKWFEIKDNVTSQIPPTARAKVATLLLPNKDWSPTTKIESVTVHQDDEKASDNTVSLYLKHGNPDNNEDLSLKHCAERYDYYDKRKNNSSLTTEEKNRCKIRSRDIILGRRAEIQTYYNSDYINSNGYYITGPSDVTAEYFAGGPQKSINAKVKTITPRDNTQPVSPQIFNTLYKIPGSIIGSSTTYMVSAILTENGVSHEIGTQSITLVNDTGVSLDYTLEIVNGQQTFVYDEKGLSPVADSETQRISIQPLSFILYDKEGTILYESANPTKYPDIDIGELKPVWRFIDAEYSLLKTNYQKPTDAPEIIDDGSPNVPKYAFKDGEFETRHLWGLLNEAYFHYTLQDNYDPSNIALSNIELQVNYQGNLVAATTSFSFSKQGELGTNGTNRALTISCFAYDNNCKDVLSQKKYCFFNRKSNKGAASGYLDTAARYYGPSARHLANPYMFATNSYSSLTRIDNELPLTDLESGRYVNLAIARDTTDNGQGIDDSVRSVEFQATWNNAPQNENSERQTKWSISDTKDIAVDNKTYHYRPLFDISSGGVVTLKKAGDIPSISDRPFYKDNNDFYYGENIVQAAATSILDNGNSVTNYAYCTMPYFYINWTYKDNGGKMPSHVDPARHIVIIGGYDQIMYDSSGHNPSYDSQTPFQFYLFDKNGKDITYEVVQSAFSLNSSTRIEWSCSPGLQKQTSGLEMIKNVKTFSALDDLVEKETLCKYNSKYYKCIKRHKKSAQNKVSNGDGTKTTYKANSFIPAYWTEVDESSYCQQMKIIPASTYESMVEANLFNSWVRLYISYKEYEAEAIIPINIYCNSYEAPELNAWDGKSITMEDGDDYSYMIANKVSAGIKDNQNRFVGISIGENIRYIAQPGSPTSVKQTEVGLFGFGQGYDGAGRTQQTLFLNARTGLAAFGPSGGSQIILDPNPQNWSRLAGWYFSQNYLLKPVGDGSISEQGRYKNLAAGNGVHPVYPSLENPKSFGIYVPSTGGVGEDTVALWAGKQKITQLNQTPKKTAEFYVTYGGKLHAEEADITGQISANSGRFGNGSDAVLINQIDGNHTYVLKHRDFWVETEQTSTETGDQGKKTTVGIRGNILAESGQIGSTRSGLDGDSNGAIFLYYKWYPWKLPADDEPFERDVTYYCDKQAGKNLTYLLYHPKFSVERDGDVRLEGSIFTEKGRIGGWVISSHKLFSYNSMVELNDNGNVRFGETNINNDGSMSGPTWRINADGSASFMNTRNTFAGSSYQLGEGSGANFTGMDDQGLHLAVGQSLTIGTLGSLTATSEAGGFVWSGQGCKLDFQSPISFDSDISLEGTHSIQFNNNLSLSASGLKIGTGTSRTTLIDNNGAARFNLLKIGIPTGNYGILSNGDITAHDITAHDITVVDNYGKQHTFFHEGDLDVRNIQAENLLIPGLIDGAHNITVNGINAEYINADNLLIPGFIDSTHSIMATNITASGSMTADYLSARERVTADEVAANNIDAEAFRAPASAIQVEVGDQLMTLEQYIHYVMGS